MKLDPEIQSYNIKDAEAMSADIEEIKSKCETLARLAESMEGNITRVEQDFTSTNMSRAKEILKKYIGRLNDAKAELAELIASVKHYEEVMRYVWKKDW